MLSFVGGVIRKLKDDLKIFTGTAHRALAEEICNSLGLPLGNSSVTRFSDGEVYFQILENVR
ncbi:MAG TPA: ribose-phosphate pyrophosphokinase-like domain-containing protein, partial [Terriglobia bacterium]|nr:ribose-phosphate pyrophosphokinase-like domain-containing protein [Terriglobia bacterium]